MNQEHDLNVTCSRCQTVIYAGLKRTQYDFYLAAQPNLPCQIHLDISPVLGSVRPFSSAAQLTCINGCHGKDGLWLVDAGSGHVDMKGRRFVVFCGKGFCEVVQQLPRAAVVALQNNVLEDMRMSGSMELSRSMEMDRALNQSMNQPLNQPIIYPNVYYPGLPATQVTPSLVISSFPPGMQFQPVMYGGQMPVRESNPNALATSPAEASLRMSDCIAISQTNH